MDKRVAFQQFALFTDDLLLQNVACGFAGVARCPSRNGPVKPAALPPIWVTSSQVQGQLVAACAFGVVRDNAMLKNVSVARAVNFNAGSKPTPTRLNAMNNPIMRFFGVYPLSSLALELKRANIATAQRNAPAWFTCTILALCVA